MNEPTPPNCIERLYLSLDAIGVCADTWFRIDVDGILDIDDLRRACHQMGDFEPRLVSRVVRTPLGYRWQPVTDRRTALRQAIFAEPDAATAEATCERPLDLARDLPLRLIVTPLSEGGQRLWLTCHHALTDGRGLLVLLRLLGEVMAGMALVRHRQDPCRLRTIYAQRPVLEWPRYAWRILRAPLDALLGARPEVATWTDHPPTPGVVGSGRALIPLPASILQMRRQARVRGVSPTALMTAVALRACHETWGNEGGLPVRVSVPVAITKPGPTTLQNHVAFVAVDLKADDLSNMWLIAQTLEETLGEETRLAAALTTMTHFVGPSLLPPILREKLARTHLRQSTNRRESLVTTWVRAEGDTLPTFSGAAVTDVAGWAHTHSPPGVRISLVSGSRHNLCLTHCAATIEPEQAHKALELMAHYLLATIGSSSETSP